MGNWKLEIGNLKLKIESLRLENDWIKDVNHNF